MDKNNNLYIILYATVITIIVAVVLAVISEFLKEPQLKNELLAKKMDILKSVGMSEVENAELYFGEHIRGVVVNSEGIEIDSINALDVDLKAQKKITDPSKRLFPLFIFTSDKGKINYVIPMRGAGLWGWISSYMALEDDFETVTGISFDHETETPGLGAEIKTDWFQSLFVGKKIMKNGSYFGIEVRKGELRFPDNQVNIISGATITSVGVSNMIQTDTEYYLPYFNKLKNS